MKQKKRKNQYRNPLSRSILIMCIVSVVLMSAAIMITGSTLYGNSMLSTYRTYLKDVLTFTSSNIDTDDLSLCIEKERISKKYEELRKLLDNIKQTHEIDSIYILKPLNDTGANSALYVIKGQTEEENNFDPKAGRNLGTYSGLDVSAEAAKNYMECFNGSGEMLCFSHRSEKGDEFTGVIPLTDSEGNRVALLGVDVSTDYLEWIHQGYIYANILLAFVFGSLLVLGMMFFMKKRIIKPLSRLEESVSAFVAKSHGQNDPSALLLDCPDINTGDEIESLSTAIKTMSEDMKNYVSNMMSASNQVEDMKEKVTKMDELANRDALTGVKNKLAYDQYSAELDRRIKDENEHPEFGIVMIDVNYLKKMNDRFGHERGNIYLKNSCNLVCSIFKHSPVFRIGGDEFAVILEGSDYDWRENLIANLKDKITKSFSDRSLEPWKRVSAATGYAGYHEDTDKSVEDVFKRSDKAMYENKLAMKAIRTD